MGFCRKIDKCNKKNKKCEFIKIPVSLENARNFALNNCMTSCPCLSSSATSSVTFLDT